MRAWGTAEAVTATLRTKERTVQATIRQDVSGAIGHYLWPSSVVTADYILRELVGKSNNAGSGTRRALELGSGCGLVAMALALAGYDVTATDKSTVLPLLQQNLSAFGEQLDAEGTRPPMRTAAFEWSEQLPEALSSVHFDVVVCCDCLYASTAVEPLLSALRNVRCANCMRVATAPQDNKATINFLS
jgi:predicted nicotinamide N-methyase